MSEELWNLVQSYLSPERLLGLLQAAVLLIAGFVLSGIVGRVVRRVTADRLELQQAILLRRVISYLIVILFAVAALHQLGFDLGVLLGAAGVLSVAIGFASQTSASNLVSGLFLIGERPFEIGDAIQVGGTTGEVLSIDLLSVKLRTFDNVFVRIPNETLIKTEVRTLTKFPIRRLDLPLGVAYHESLEHAREVLLEVADAHPLCLDEPAAQVMLLGFGASSIDLQFSVWGRKEGWVDFKNSVLEAVKTAFDDADIEIPFPQRSLQSGRGAEPFPVRVVPSEERPDSQD